MGNRPQQLPQQVQKQSVPQTEEQKTNKPVVVTTVMEKKKQEDNLETEFFKFLVDKSRKDKWKKYFEIQKIFNMEDLLSSYQMNKETKTGKRLNEAEIQILNNYLLRQQRADDVKINIKEIQDLKIFKQPEPSDQFYLQIRNILIIGITGQGKSTFINSFVTAIEKEFKPREKKQFELDYFQIIKIKDSQAQSDTNQVSSYKFTYKNCLLNLIDTPGLADTQGPQKDQERITQISEYIRDELYNKNQKLHAVLFVSQSSTQYEIIEGNPSLLQLSMLSILKLFGKQMCQFTKHCLTFSDFTATSTQNFESQDSIFYSIREEQILIKQKKKNQLQTNIIHETAIQNESENIFNSNNLQEEEIANQKKEEFYYQFQNSVFRAEKQGFIENIHFKKNFQNYQNLFEFICDPNNEGFSLDETTNVIQERATIKYKLQDLQGQLLIFLKIIKSIDENTRKLQIYQNKAEDTKGYETKLFLTEWEKKPIFKHGRKAYSTNCMECSKTCCLACESQKLQDCVQLIDKWVETKYIKYCECGHSIDFHSQQEFSYQPKQVIKTEVNEELKSEHSNAQKSKEMIDGLLKEQKEKRKAINKEILNVLKIMKDCLTQLLSSALYKLDILDVEAIDFVLKFYPEYKNVLQEFKDKQELLITSETRQQIKKDRLLASKTLQSIQTQQFQSKQLRRS
ncbi:unnamed protein product [Paramecium sonneborni]|uniref:Tr-type G domain-containing protein n=1 Tax=Paramecium sonneborni TaxID=65129 RepID=A0A8S1N3I4_9CILI|nr:unnamed protein product [Paramecium sonneborni]